MFVSRVLVLLSFLFFVYALDVRNGPYRRNDTGLGPFPIAVPAQPQSPPNVVGSNHKDNYTNPHPIAGVPGSDTVTAPPLLPSAGLPSLGSSSAYWNPWCPSNRTHVHTGTGPCDCSDDTGGHYPAPTQNATSPTAASTLNVTSSESSAVTLTTSSSSSLIFPASSNFPSLSANSSGITIGPTAFPSGAFPTGFHGIGTGYWNPWCPSNRTHVHTGTGPCDCSDDTFHSHSSTNISTISSTFSTLNTSTTSTKTFEAIPSSTSASSGFPTLSSNSSGITLAPTAYPSGAFPTGFHGTGYWNPWCPTNRTHVHIGTGPCDCSNDAGGQYPATNISVSSSTLSTTNTSTTLSDLSSATTSSSVSSGFPTLSANSSGITRGPTAYPSGVFPTGAQVTGYWNPWCPSNRTHVHTGTGPCDCSNDAGGYPSTSHSLSNSSMSLTSSASANTTTKAGGTSLNPTSSSATSGFPSMSANSSDSSSTTASSLASSGFPTFSANSSDSSSTTASSLASSRFPTFSANSSDSSSTTASSLASSGFPTFSANSSDSSSTTASSLASSRFPTLSANSSGITPGPSTFPSGTFPTGFHSGTGYWNPWCPTNRTHVHTGTGPCDCSDDAGGYPYTSANVNSSTIRTPSVPLSTGPVTVTSEPIVSATPVVSVNSSSITHGPTGFPLSGVFPTSLPGTGYWNPWCPTNRTHVHTGTGPCDCSNDAGGWYPSTRTNNSTTQLSSRPVSTSSLTTTSEPLISVTPIVSANSSTFGNNSTTSSPTMILSTGWTSTSASPTTYSLAGAPSPTGTCTVTPGQSVCPSCDGEAYDDANGAEYVIACGVSYSGSDANPDNTLPKRDTVVTSSLEDCLAQCDLVLECTIVNFYAASGKCRLLSTAIGYTKDADCIGAYYTGRAPTSTSAVSSTSSNSTIVTSSSLVSAAPLPSANSSSIITAGPTAIPSGGFPSGYPGGFSNTGGSSYWNPWCPNNRTHVHIGTGPCDCGADLGGGYGYPVTKNSTAAQSSASPSSILLTTSQTDATSTSSSVSSTSILSSTSAVSNNSSSITIGPTAIPSGGFPPSFPGTGGSSYWNPWCPNNRTHVHTGTGPCDCGADLGGGYPVTKNSTTSQSATSLSSVVLTTSQPDTTTTSSSVSGTATVLSTTLSSSTSIVSSNSSSITLGPSAIPSGGFPPGFPGTGGSSYWNPWCPNNRTHVHTGTGPCDCSADLGGGYPTTNTSSVLPTISLTTDASTTSTSIDSNNSSTTSESITSTSVSLDSTISSSSTGSQTVSTSLTNSTTHQVSSQPAITIMPPPLPTSFNISSTSMYWNPWCPSNRTHIHTVTGPCDCSVDAGGWYTTGPPAISIPLTTSSATSSESLSTSSAEISSTTSSTSSSVLIETSPTSSESSTVSSTSSSTSVEAVISSKSSENSTSSMPSTSSTSSSPSESFSTSSTPDASSSAVLTSAPTISLTGGDTSFTSAYWNAWCPSNRTHVHTGTGPCDCSNDAGGWYTAPLTSSSSSLSSSTPFTTAAFSMPRPRPSMPAFPSMPPRPSLPTFSAVTSSNPITPSALSSSVSSTSSESSTSTSRALTSSTSTSSTGTSPTLASATTLTSETSSATSTELSSETSMASTDLKTVETSMPVQPSITSAPIISLTLGPGGYMPAESGYTGSYFNTWCPNNRTHVHIGTGPCNCGDDAHYPGTTALIDISSTPISESSLAPIFTASSSIFSTTTSLVVSETSTLVATMSSSTLLPSSPLAVSSKSSMSASPTTSLSAHQSLPVGWGPPAGGFPGRGGQSAPPSYSRPPFGGLPGNGGPPWSQDNPTTSVSSMRASTTLSSTAPVNAVSSSATTSSHANTLVVPTSSESIPESIPAEATITSAPEISLTSISGGFVPGGDGYTGGWINTWCPQNTTHVHTGTGPCNCGNDLPPFTWPYGGWPQAGGQPSLTSQEPPVVSESSAPVSTISPAAPIETIPAFMSTQETSSSASLTMDEPVDTSMEVTATAEVPESTLSGPSITSGPIISLTSVPGDYLPMESGYTGSYFNTWCPNNRTHVHIGTGPCDCGDDSTPFTYPPGGQGWPVTGESQQQVTTTDSASTSTQAPVGITQYMTSMPVSTSSFSPEAGQPSTSGWHGFPSPSLPWSFPGFPAGGHANSPPASASTQQHPSTSSKSFSESVAAGGPTSASTMASDQTSVSQSSRFSGVLPTESHPASGRPGEHGPPPGWPRPTSSWAFPGPGNDPGSGHEHSDAQTFTERLSSTEESTHSSSSSSVAVTMPISSTEIETHSSASSTVVSASVVPSVSSSTVSSTRVSTSVVSFMSSSSIASSTELVPTTSHSELSTSLLHPSSAATTSRETIRSSSSSAVHTSSSSIMTTLPSTTSSISSTGYGWPSHYPDQSHSSWPPHPSPERTPPLGPATSVIPPAYSSTTVTESGTSTEGHHPSLHSVQSSKSSSATVLTESTSTKAPSTATSNEKKPTATSIDNPSTATSSEKTSTTALAGNSPISTSTKKSSTFTSTKGSSSTASAERSSTSASTSASTWKTFTKTSSAKPVSYTDHETSTYSSSRTFRASPTSLKAYSSSTIRSSSSSSSHLASSSTSRKHTASTYSSELSSSMRTPSQSQYTRSSSSTSSRSFSHPHVRPSSAPSERPVTTFPTSSSSSSTTCTTDSTMIGSLSSHMTSSQSTMTKKPTSTDVTQNHSQTMQSVVKPSDQPEPGHAIAGHHDGGYQNGHGAEEAEHSEYKSRPADHGSGQHETEVKDHGHEFSPHQGSEHHEHQAEHHESEHHGPEHHKSEHHESEHHEFEHHESEHHESEHHEHEFQPHREPESHSSNDELQSDTQYGRLVDHGIGHLEHPPGSSKEEEHAAEQGMHREPNSSHSAERPSSPVSHQGSTGDRVSHIEEEQYSEDMEHTVAHPDEQKSDHNTEGTNRVHHATSSSSHSGDEISHAAQQTASHDHPTTPGKIRPNQISGTHGTEPDEPHASTSSFPTASFKSTAAAKQTLTTLRKIYPTSSATPPAVSAEPTESQPQSYHVTEANDQSDTDGHDALNSDDVGSGDLTSWWNRLFGPKLLGWVREGLDDDDA